MLDFTVRLRYNVPDRIKLNITSTRMRSIMKTLLKIVLFPFKVVIGTISWLTGGWADSLSNKFRLQEKAENSRIRAWADSLTGWKYWAWQIGAGLVIICVFEYIFGLVGYTILPWRMF